MPTDSPRTVPGPEQRVIPEPATTVALGESAARKLLGDPEEPPFSPAEFDDEPSSSHNRRLRNPSAAEPGEEGRVEGRETILKDFSSPPYESDPEVSSSRIRRLQPEIKTPAGEGAGKPTPRRSASSESVTQPRTKGPSDSHPIQGPLAQVLGTAPEIGQKNRAMLTANLKWMTHDSGMSRKRVSMRSKLAKVPLSFYTRNGGTKRLHHESFSPTLLLFFRSRDLVCLRVNLWVCPPH